MVAMSVIQQAKRDQWQAALPEPQQGILVVVFLEKNNLKRKNMEFKSLKNIESSFKQIRLFSIIFLCLCAAITVYAVWSSYNFAEAQRHKIYVLDNGKSLMLALSQDLSQN